MTVLAVPEALPAALLVTYRLLLTQGPLTRQEAGERLAPSPQHSAFTDADNKTVRAAFSEGLGMGLFVEEEGRICLAPFLTEASPTVAAFRQIARRLILDPANPRNHDLNRAISWFLSLSPYQAPAAQSWSDIQVQHPQATDFIGNDIRWGNFQRWAQFLGFAERDIVGRDRKVRDVLMPNPTPALRDCWAEVTKGLSGPVTLSEFIAAASRVMPVLDGGYFGREFAPTEEGKDPAHTLSASYSLAILELQSEGRLSLDDRSDIGKWRLQHPGGLKTMYSHLILKEGLRA